MLPSQEVGFAQTGELSCFCCGDGDYLRDCKKKGILPKEEWVKSSYWKQSYVDEEKKRQEKRDKEKRKPVHTFNWIPCVASAACRCKSSRKVPRKSWIPGVQ